MMYSSCAEEMFADICAVCVAVIVYCDYIETGGIFAAAAWNISGVNASHLQPIPERPQAHPFHRSSTVIPRQAIKHFFFRFSENISQKLSDFVF